MNHTFSGEALDAGIYSVAGRELRKLPYPRWDISQHQRVMKAARYTGSFECIMVVRFHHTYMSPHQRRTHGRC